jgi:hypothetical protein
MNCPHCHREVPADVRTAGCPFCGQSLNVPSGPVSAPRPYGTDKSMALLLFWVAFLGGPILALLLARSGQALIFPVFGAVVSGFALARAYARTAIGVIVGGLLLSVGVIVVYVGILFVGCFALAGR